MVGPGLPTNLDSTYADSGTDATQKLHQQHHDSIGNIVNAFDTTIGSGASRAKVPVWNPTSSSYKPSLPGGAALNIKDYGATVGSADNYTAIQTALDDAESTTHRVYVPSTEGFFKTNTPLEVHDKVQFFGDGRADGGIEAGTSFPTTGESYLCRIGDIGSSTLTFGTRIHDMRLHGRGRAQKIVYSTVANEQSGVFRCHVDGYTHTGIHFYQGSCISLEDLEMSCDAAGVSYGIHFEECANDNLIKRVTWGPGSSSHAIGLRLYHSQTIGIALHIENATVGVDFDDSSGILIGVSGTNTIASVTTLIRTQNGQHCQAYSVVKGVATNSIVDSVASLTVTEDVNAWIAGRLLIRGTTARPTVTGSKGGNAALSSLMTALGSSGLNLVTDSTS